MEGHYQPAWINGYDSTECRPVPAKCHASQIVPKLVRRKHQMEHAGKSAQEIGLATRQRLVSGLIKEEFTSIRATAGAPITSPQAGHTSNDDG